MGICLDTEQNNEELETGGERSRRDSAWPSSPSGVPFPMQNSSHVKFEPPAVPVIFVLGGPGSGKVTHCDNLMQERRGMVHINMTDLLQQYAIGNDMLDFGTLSSKTVTEVLMLEMKMAPTAKAYLVSGYPRSMRDVAEYADKIQTVSGVVLVSWRQRVLERQIEYGARLGHVVLSLARMELKNFYKHVMPVADYFDQSNMLIAVNGERNPEEVYKDFRAAVLQILGAVEDQNMNGVGVGARGIPGEIVGVEPAPTRNHETAHLAAEDLDIDDSMTIEPVTIVPAPVTVAPVPRFVPVNGNVANVDRVVSPNPELIRVRGTTSTTTPPTLWVVGGPGSNKAGLCQRAVEQRHGWVHFRSFQVQISENALFLIDIQVVYRLIDLMTHKNPVVREKVCIILSSLSNYYQGRKKIISRPVVIDHLMWLIMRDRREIRYSAAYTLRTLTRDRCAAEVILGREKIIVNLLKMVKHEHIGIVNIHLKTLENLIEWNQVQPLKANAFRVMFKLFQNRDFRIVSGAMDCMMQLCKHDVGKKLADVYDLTFVLRPFLVSPSIEVRISAVGLMQYTTLTTRSKWRAKECCDELTKRLIVLCHCPNIPLLQLRSMQVLINLCDCPDIRHHIKSNFEKKVKAIKIRDHEEWDGTSETTTYCFETGHNYRTMCIEGVETIQNDLGDNAEVINVHSYLRRLTELKERLLYAINWQSFKD